MVMLCQVTIQCGVVVLSTTNMGERIFEPSSEKKDTLSFKSFIRLW